MSDTTALTRNKLTDVEAIKSWYSNPEEFGELTSHQEEKRNRLLLAQSMMLAGRLNSEIVTILRSDYDLSQAQAQRDIRQAIGLYGNIRKAEKEGIRYILYELSQKVFNKAMAVGNLKQANAAISNLTKITGVDKEDPELPDFEKLSPSINVIVISDDTKNQLQGLLSGGVVNLTEIRKNQEQKQKITEHEDLSGTTD